MSRRHSRAIFRPPPAATPRHLAGVPAATTIERARALFASGACADAESLCRSILARQADHAGALALLGIMLARSRRPAEAAQLLGRAAALLPNDSSAHNNYGNVLRDLGRHVSALSCYERALAIQPDYADAHYNRAVVLQELGRPVEALENYDRAIALKRDYASAWNNRGATLRALGRLDEALASHERAIAIRTDYAEAHNNRGVALQELARLDEALVSYDRAIALRPQHAEAHSNRGAVLRKLERFEEALESYDRAIAMRPDYPEAYNGRGVVLKELERFEDALASYDRAIAIKPDYTEACTNRGAALRGLRRYAEALASLERALQIDPCHADAYANQGAVLTELKSFREALASYDRALALKEDLAGYVAQGFILHELKRSEEAVAAYRRALALAPDGGFLLGALRHVRMQLCDWTELDGDMERITAGIESDRPIARPFNVLSLIDSPRLQRKASEIMARIEFSPRRKPVPLISHSRHDRIRLGYFSADLHNHAVTVLTAELFESHDRSRFDITAFSLGANVRDESRKRIEPAFERFLWLGAQSDREVVELSRRMEIDIAVDLGGYTGDARPRIMALRAAPIQVSYLGYLGTMGADFMDYLIADPVIVPPEAREHYSEKIAYLPSYQVNDTKRAIADKTFTRAELGLPETGFVFCCFNASYKITPDVFGGWMRALAAVPDSVLFLLGGNAVTERNLRQAAASHGVSPQRLVFGGRLGSAEYLARYRAADLFLDTSPYNAGTTASDALFAGLPVLTRIGNSFAARVAASVLTAVGLPELIAGDGAEYEHLAVELATRPERLATIRRKLAENRASCALFDTPTLTRKLESLYTRMYERHLAGLPPDHLEAE